MLCDIWWVLWENTCTYPIMVGISKRGFISRKLDFPIILIQNMWQYVEKKQFYTILKIKKLPIFFNLKQVNFRMTLVSSVHTLIFLYGYFQILHRPTSRAWVHAFGFPNVYFQILHCPTIRPLTCIWFCWWLLPNSTPSYVLGLGSELLQSVDLNWSSFGALVNQHMPFIRCTIKS